MSDRLIDYAVAIVKTDPEQRVFDIIDLVAAKKALKHLIAEARAAQKQISDSAFRMKWKVNAKARSAKLREQADAASFEKKERAAWLRTPEGKAELAEKRKERAELNQFKDKLQKEGTKAISRINRALEVEAKLGDLYDTLKLAGKAIGDVHYRELYKLRTEGVFEAALCDQILRHARPNTNAKIRDIVTPDKLKEFEAIALQAVGRVEREGVVALVVPEKKWSWQIPASHTGH